MAFKIYVENNHIVVQDLVSDKEFRAASKEALFFKDRVSEDTYNTNGFFPEGLQGIKFSDIVDENEIPFVNEQAFIDFFSANTGNFNSGGATPQSKIYKAYLTQVGTDAPTATIIKNTIGNITWSYNDLGIYSANLTGAFTINKTNVILPNQVKVAGDGETSQMWWCIEDSSADSIVIQSSGASYDEVMYKQVIIIEVEN